MIVTDKAESEALEGWKKWFAMCRTFYGRKIVLLELDGKDYELTDSNHVVIEDRPERMSLQRLVSLEDALNSSGAEKLLRFLCTLEYVGVDEAYASIKN